MFETHLRQLRALYPWCVAVAFWTVFVAAGAAYQSLRTGYPARMLPYDLLLVCMAAACSILLTSLLRRVESHPFPVQALAAAGLVILLVFPFEITFRWLFHALGEGRSPAEIGYTRLLATSFFWLPPFGCWAAGTLALQNNRTARDREMQAAEARLQAHEAQVRTLRYQINPHFLYNTLNSVSSLIMDGRNAEADAMVLDLAAFFRASLSVDPAGDVPLKDEIEHQLLYLGIEQARFVDRVRVTVDIPPPLEKAGVPSFILQPLVENAMKHGLRGAGRKLHLRLAAHAENDDLLLDVIDDGAGTSDLQGTGTGLSNVERRLRTRYGDRATLETGGGVGGFHVRLTLPLQLRG